MNTLIWFLGIGFMVILGGIVYKYFPKKPDSGDIYDEPGQKPYEGLIDIDRVFQDEDDELEPLELESD